MINGAELDVPGDGGQEWHIIDETNIRAEFYIRVMFQDICWNRGHWLYNDMSWLSPNSLASHSRNVGTENVNRSVHVLDRNWGVSQLVVTYKVDEGVMAWSTDHGVDASG